MRASRFQILAIVLAACSPSAEAPTSAVAPAASSTAAPTSSTTADLVFAGVPSQSPEDAARDGVLPIIAAAPNELRIDRQMELGDSGWSWVVSRLSEEFRDLTEDEGCRIGQLDYVIPPVCEVEYGELLLMEGDRIFRAFPMPAAPVSWLHLANDAVYGGRIGDGGLPSSTLIRIDRVSLENDVVVFVHPSGSAEDIPESWRIASSNESTDYQSLVGFLPMFTGLAVESPMGDVAIDLDGIRHLFDPTHAVSPVGQVLVEAVTRCGITCFEISYRRTPSTAKWVYPPEMPLAAAETITVDCGAVPAGIEVLPVDGLDPAWGGQATGCEAVLSFGRWAFYSHYFHLEDGEPMRFAQTPGPWVVKDTSQCWGDPSTPPACDIGHEGEPTMTYVTISSVAARGTSVTLAGTEWDIQWVGAYEVGGPLGEITKVLDCGTPVDVQGERGEGWVRYLDACLLAQLYASGEGLSGIFAIYENDVGVAFGVVQVPAIELP